MALRVGYWESCEAQLLSILHFVSPHGISRNINAEIDIRTREPLALLASNSIFSIFLSALNSSQHGPAVICKPPLLDSYFRASVGMNRDMAVPGISTSISDSAWSRCLRVHYLPAMRMDSAPPDMLCCVVMWRDVIMIRYGITTIRT